MKYLFLILISIGCAFIHGEAATHEVQTRYSNPSLSQKHWWSRMELNIGVHAGPSFFDSASSVNEQNTGVDTGGIVGTLVEGKLWRFIYLQHEISYVKKGMSFAGGSYNAHYLEFPTLAKFKPRETYYSFRPYALIGPTLAIQLSADRNGQDFSDSLTALDLAFDVGAGVERDIGRRITTFFTIRGSFGILNNATGPSQYWRNIGFNMVLGAKYRI